jgi:hypothetical protein
VIVDFDSIYELAIKPSIADSGLEPIRGDKELTGGIIHVPMFARIFLAEFMVADLTLSNPNVFYELGIRHANLLVYWGLERAASRLFIVREWVHGFSLYDLLRIRRSLKPEEVLAVLEPLPATLDLISERGFGLVAVSIRKLFISCPTDVQPDEFKSLAKGDARAWANCTLKLNPLSLAPLLFRQRRDWSSQTLVPRAECSR